MVHQQTLAKLFCLLTAAGKAAAQDVSVDVSLLSDFTTSFVFDLKQMFQNDIAAFNDEEEGQMPFTMVALGKLTANIPGEKLQLSVDLIGSVTPSAAFGGYSGNSNGSYVLTVDGPSGYVALEEKGHANVAGLPGGPYSLQGSSCLMVSFNPSVLPPPKQVQAMVDQYKTQASAMVKSIPHAVAGDLAYLETPEFTLAVRTKDGSPSGMWPTPRNKRKCNEQYHYCYNTTGTPEDAMKFAQSHKPFLTFGAFLPAENIAEASCSSSLSSVQMLANPRVQRALSTAEQVLNHMQRTAHLQPLTGHMIAHAPQMLRNAGKAPMCPGSQESMLTAPSAEQLGPIATVALCMLFGAVGGGIALFTLRRMSRKMPRDAFLA